MMIVYLIVIAFFLTLCNFVVARNDFLNPSVLFCGMNLVYSVVALVVVRAYNISFHGNTILVFSSGMLVFTIFNILYRSFRMRHIGVSRKSSNVYRSYIKIRTEWVVLFVLFEIVVAYFMIKYAKSVSKAFYGSSGGLANALGNYNRVIKTRGDELSQLGVHASVVYTLGWPLCIAFNTILSAVAISNYKITHRVPVLLIIPYIIMVGMSFLNASRSTAFRFLTQIVIEYIIIHRWHQRSNKRGNLKLFIRILVIGSIAIIGIASSINLLGRKSNQSQKIYSDLDKNHLEYKFLMDAAE